MLGKFDKKIICIHQTEFMNKIAIVALILISNHSFGQSSDPLLGTWIEEHSIFDNYLDEPVNRRFRKYNFVSLDSVDISTNPFHGGKR